MTIAVPIRQPVTEEYPYEGDAFYQSWWQHLAPKFPIVQSAGDFVVLQKPIIKGLLHVRELRLAGWNNAWTQDLTEARVQFLTTHQQALQWDCFRMVWNKSRQSQQAFEALSQLGFQLKQIPFGTDYCIDLSQGWDQYLMQLGRATRKDIRRKFTRAEVLRPEIRTLQSTEAVERFFRKFFRHHLPYWDSKEGHSYFHDLREQAFIITWAMALAQNRQLVLDEVLLGGDVVNMSMNIVAGKTQYALLTINTGLHVDYAPGIIGLHLRLQEAARNGIQTYNLGGGDYPYKQQHATLQVPMFELVAINPQSLTGRLYGQWLDHRLKQPSA